MPVGFVHDEQGGIVLDPDSQVQHVVRFLFDSFRQTGSAYGVVHRFSKAGLQFPKRAYGGAWNGRLIWGRLTGSRVLGALNNPAYTGNNLTPQLVARLAEVPGIIGLKESNADLGQLVESIRVSPRGFSVCTGIDSQFYPSLCAGAQGVFSTAASAIPGQMVELYEVFLAGEHDRARDLHLRVQSLNRYLEYEPGYVAPCKEVLRLLGMPGGAVRRPLPSLTEEEKAGVRSALEELGLL